MAHSSPRAGPGMSGGGSEVGFGAGCILILSEAAPFMVDRAVAVSTSSLGKLSAVPRCPCGQARWAAWTRHFLHSRVSPCPEFSVAAPLPACGRHFRAGRAERVGVASGRGAGHRGAPCASAPAAAHSEPLSWLPSRHLLWASSPFCASGRGGPSRQVVLPESSRRDPVARGRWRGSLPEVSLPDPHGGQPASWWIRPKTPPALPHPAPFRSSSDRIC